MIAIDAKVEDDEKVELIKEPVDPEEEKRQLEEEKRLHKAREVGLIIIDICLSF